MVYQTKTKLGRPGVSWLLRHPWVVRKGGEFLARLSNPNCAVDFARFRFQIGDFVTMGFEPVAELATYVMLGVTVPEGVTGRALWLQRYEVRPHGLVPLHPEEAVPVDVLLRQRRSI